MTEEMAKDPPVAGTAEKAFTATLFVLMGVMGVSSFIIGLVNMNSCGNALLLPVMLAANGAIWVFPILILLFLNCGSPGEEDVRCLYSFLHPFFILSILFLFASTIYLVVSATQLKTLDSVCSEDWLPPYALCVLAADWVILVIVSCLFCRVQMPPEKPPPVEFRHLKNLPPLIIPWNRHRVLRTY